jgi:hypothetical protein
MNKLLIWAGALALALIASPSLAQTGTSVQFPGGWAPSTSICVKQVDGTCTPVSTTNPLPVTGGTGGGGGSGTDPRVAQGSSTTGQTISLSACAVVTGDQAYTVGTTQPCNLTGSGRLKVALSSATNIVPAVQPASTLAADLLACTYRIPVAWAAGWTGALQCRADGSLDVTVRPALNAYTTTSPVTVAAAAGATLIEAGVAGRSIMSVQVEASGTAIIYLCSMGQAICSATVHNALIPANAAIGTEYYFVPTSAAIYAFSTGGYTLKANSAVTQ